MTVTAVCYTLFTSLPQDPLIPNEQLQVNTNKALSQTEGQSGQEEAVCLLDQLTQIASVLHLMGIRVCQRKRREWRACDWMLVAQVIDRLFFIIFTILMAVVHISIFITCDFRA